MQRSGHSEQNPEEVSSLYNSNRAKVTSQSVFSPQTPHLIHCPYFRPNSLLKGLVNWSKCREQLTLWYPPPINTSTTQLLHLKVGSTVDNRGRRANEQDVFCETVSSILYIHETSTIWSLNKTYIMTTLSVMPIWVGEIL